MANIDNIGLAVG